MYGGGVMKINEYSKLCNFYDVKIKTAFKTDELQLASRDFVDILLWFSLTTRLKKSGYKEFLIGAVQRLRVVDYANTYIDSV